jgi:lipoyl(octanoyl) transferase
MEQAVIDFLAGRGVIAGRLSGAPGVYVEGAKIAALGLRVKQGCTYHGLALNLDMDLAPFAAINPCGYAGMRVTQCRDLGISMPMEDAQRVLSQILLTRIYT